MDERPKVGVGVLIIKDNKILFIKRKGAHGEGSWCPPGGHLEFNEQLEECAIREVLEETGIKISNIKFAGLTNDIFETEGKHYITIHMLADYESGQEILKEPEKSTEIKWFDWNNLPQPLFVPTDNLVKQGFNPFKPSQNSS